VLWLSHLPGARSCPLPFTRQAARVRIYPRILLTNHETQALLHLHRIPAQSRYSRRFAEETAPALRSRPPTRTTASAPVRPSQSIVDLRKTQQSNTRGQLNGALIAHCAGIAGETRCIRLSPRCWHDQPDLFHLKKDTQSAFRNAGCYARQSAPVPVAPNAHFGEGSPTARLVRK
jgi:hypothetical protein